MLLAQWPYIVHLQATSFYRKNRIVSVLIPVLLQFHIATEETKFGFSLEEIETSFAHQNLSAFEFVQFSGVMGMATFTENENQIRNENKNITEMPLTEMDLYWERVKQKLER